MPKEHKVFHVTLTDGKKRTVNADRYEHTDDGGVIFLDSDGNEVKAVEPHDIRGVALRDQ